VYLRQGLDTRKKEVMVRLTNANDAVILAGVSEGDRVYLSVPSGMENDPIVLLPEMSGKRKRPAGEEPEITAPDLLEGGGQPARDERRGRGRRPDGARAGVARTDSTGDASQQGACGCCRTFTSPLTPYCPTRCGRSLPPWASSSV